MKRVPVSVVATASLLLGVASAMADSVTWSPSEGASITEDTAPLALVSRPRTDRVLMDIDPGTVAHAVNSNKVYLNNCKPNGCIVRPGQASSLDGSGYQGMWGISSTRTLTAFGASDAVWTQVVDCVKQTFSPFGIEITTTNPSPGPHFEIMIAGSPTDLGMNSNTGGVSPFNCGVSYIPNSLVFAFQKVYGTDVDEICATASQEIAHSFALDHVTDASDPLTYFPYSGRRRFKDAEVNCGSDCVGGQSPFGATCTGTNQQLHACACTGRATQNSFQTIKALFGAGTPTPPMVTITNPKLGASVAPGFPIVVTATDDVGIGRVEVFVDDVNTGTLVNGPYAFNAPTTLADGTHRVRATAYDVFGTSASAETQVVIGAPCGKPADCAKDTDTCIGGRCVTGPNAPGGLGQPCMSGPDCSSGTCAQRGTDKYCVELCELGAGQCPEGFGCLDASGTGLCWPGYDDGTGGICSAGGKGGAVTLGLTFAALLFSRRRRRS